LELAQPWSVEQAISDLKLNKADWTNAPGKEVPAAVANTMIRIDVDGPCDLAHLKLFRDLYYTQVTDTFTQRVGRAGTATQDNPLKLNTDEFFAMGDNSRQSSDGRLWNRVNDPLGDLGVRPGIVPRRYLLGKAFFVYWPAGFVPTDRVSILRELPLVPNTGSMRIIR
jgi:hypothetical protein